MTQLRQIFQSLDKISDKWEPYFDVYERHLAKFVNTSPHVLEIGVQNGGSIDMWFKWFGEGSRILGVDITPECAQLDYPSNVEIVLGDQADPHFWRNTLEGRPQFDVVIDDGGHTMTQQIISLEMLWPQLALGGVYVCEDTHTSYWPDWGGGFDHPRSFQSYSKRLTDYLNREHVGPGLISRGLERTFGDTLASIHFYNSQVVFEKSQTPPFQRVFSNA